MASISKSDYIWFNGKVVPWNDVKIHPISHVLHYGTSVWEGLRSYETYKGVAIFRHTAHINRLFNSAKVYRLNFDYSKEDIRIATKQVLKASNLTNAYIRPLIFLGDIGIEIYPPEDVKAEVLIAPLKWSGEFLSETGLEQGVDICISSWRRFALNTIPAGAKAGGNYLSSLLIGTEARRNGYAEGLALDVNGYVSEGAAENIFLVSNNVLYTPPLSSSVLPGITRDTIIILAKDLGIEVVEQTLSRESLYLADEVFMTGTAAEITPIHSIDDIIIASGKRGPITKRLQQVFFGLFNGETEDKYNWLDVV